MKRTATSDPCTPIHPDAIDCRTALDCGFTAKQFRSWQFAGYDDSGDECRFPPKEKGEK